MPCRSKDVPVFLCKSEALTEIGRNRAAVCACRYLDRLGKRRHLSRFARLTAGIFRCGPLEDVEAFLGSLAQESQSAARPYLLPAVTMHFQAAVGRGLPRKAGSLACRAVFAAAPGHSMRTPAACNAKNPFKQDLNRAVPALTQQ